MKLRTQKDVDDFTQVLNKCESTVWLISAEGNKLNLMSGLACYVGISKLLESDEDWNVHCNSYADETRFFEFFKCHDVL